MSNKNQKLILEKEKIEVDRKVFEKPCRKNTVQKGRENSRPFCVILFCRLTRNLPF